MVWLDNFMKIILLFLSHYCLQKKKKKIQGRIIFSSVIQSCPTLCDPMNHSTPGVVSITNSRSSLKLMYIESGMPSSHPILCRPLLLLCPQPLPASGSFPMSQLFA